jgi:predicted SAM-dependent methyltransferase
LLVSAPNVLSPDSSKINHSTWKSPENEMSLKRLLVSYCPSPVIAGAKRLHNRGRAISSRSYARRLLRGSQPISLELGSGSKRGSNGWTTIDMAPGCDLYCNLARGIPFPDGTVQNIYSSHFFEHLTYQQTQILLGECLRVMVPGGRFSICVPNARIYLEAYFRNLVLEEDRFLKYAPAYNRTTKMDYVNYVAYMDEDHKYMFDEENLVYLLERRGFKNVRMRNFDPELDLKERDCISIYAEGFK